MYNTERYVVKKVKDTYDVIDSYSGKEILMNHNEESATRNCASLNKRWEPDGIWHIDVKAVLQKEEGDS